MDRAAAAWRLPTAVADASERGIRVAMRLLRALKLTMCMCAGTTEACFDISLLPNLGFLAGTWEIQRLDGPSCCGVAVAN